MADSLTGRIWLGRLTFVLISLFVIYTHLIPLETVPPGLGGISLEPLVRQTPNAATFPETLTDPARWIAPDFLILLALAWVVRRPSFAPAITIGLVFLLADMLFQRPPGLWAGMAVILTEVLRGRSRSMRTLPFWLEWATVSAGLVAITVIYRFTLSMVLVPQAPLGLTLAQLGLTLLFYPVVVFVSYIVFGVNRPAPGEVDALGHKV